MAASRHGLQSSVWASNSHHTPTARQGDWACPSCRFDNFASRSACLKCSFPRPGATRGFGGRENVAPSCALPDGPQICERVNPHTNAPCNTTFSRRYDFERHQDVVHGGRLQSETTLVMERSAPLGKTVQVIPPRQEYVQELDQRHGIGGGLLASRWAPREYAGRRKKANVNEVWIRTLPTESIPNGNQEAHPAVSNITEIDLPYEVQHCILTIIQRILEEGCFDFATKWIPDILAGNRWTCSEAVELSSWRKTLPTSVPSHALVTVRNRSLETTLADAVRIRNAAAHRHLESNAELRKMALQARDLMTMFSDASRVKKFTRLHDELNEWERETGKDEHAARMRLQDALQEIAERPMDEMDWTPNAVSLVEIVESHVGAGHAEHQQQHELNRYETN
ncbi:hypothetical protein BP5796_08182 [Coleophoma crateriformis]|uniref:RanBP2-type domain-containing protein n=1 Tax=Coleophoma crateriformis TaxID=565419 RepID=A0A3D8RE01_9HELO|nr:hypothetical protein BP5796_08182 [Coleophoma crateriformis]